jgi:hypothetical protein
MEIAGRLRDVEARQVSSLASATAALEVLRSRESGTSATKLQERHDAWQSTLTEDLSLVSHTDAAPGVAQILLSQQLEDDLVRGEVSAHMLHRLEVAHGHTVSGIYDARKKLMNERLVLTNYLDGIRTHTLDHETWVSAHMYIHTCTHVHVHMFMT